MQSTTQGIHTVLLVRLQNIYIQLQTFAEITETSEKTIINSHKPPCQVKLRNRFKLSSKNRGKTKVTLQLTMKIAVSPKIKGL